ncbi:1-deoxy-D-xylulose-5-phosphate reductoisomerase [Marinisporobacter balticus]|uniref:1-deoxy-D-xylulose 5-phosphate reductoisomerase n=1 Tax=Marinisporobacter balticus TaxID=2018667 RepID=A0A4R2LAW3_9FIRM|nr:1-deoxy-D-xylulose-5-phosphate reductoisomerase [Marinisporobacter balticus]TCO79908.1 1-deoxy-D-xylulose 5-phosphate reductoisomerase [Marinisporobacter balticus]
MKCISILGSTGSIGTQTLDVVRNNKEKFNIVGLSANNNIDLLEKQIKEFHPVAVSVMNEKKALELKKRLGNIKTKVFYGLDGLTTIATLEASDLIVTAVVGMIGLIPTIEAIKCKKDIALANKETLVTAGEIVMKEAKRNNVAILPVDSEHSAIFQCLMGYTLKDIRRIILTASGGPFRGYKKAQLQDVTVKEALNHPKWNMGKKISIDSATLMNKGLEIIEAKWLFDLSLDQIDVVIHPQSIIHSMVEYKDSSVIAQMGYPDMRVPIQFALTYPSRTKNNYKKLNLLEVATLTFEKPDRDTFPCLNLAYEALRIGGSLPTVLNAANEELVALFIQQRIGFYDIPRIVELALEKHDVQYELTIDEIIQMDRWARNFVKKISFKAV